MFCSVLSLSCDVRNEVEADLRRRGLCYVMLCDVRKKLRQICGGEGVIRQPLWVSSRPASSEQTARGQPRCETQRSRDQEQATHVDEEDEVDDAVAPEERRERALGKRRLS
jgi:hypothetical protein